MSKNIDLTLTEDELYRVYMSLHCKLSEWNRNMEFMPFTGPAVAAKYQAVLDKVSDLYSAFYGGTDD